MRPAILSLLVCAICGMLPGQVRTGAMTGTVVDPDGGSVPLATVQATELSTGRVYKAVSGIDGSYVLSALPEGTFDIMIPPIGFTFPKFGTKKASKVQAGQTVKLELRLVCGWQPGNTRRRYFQLGPQQRTSPAWPTPRTPDGKPDFSPASGSEILAESGGCLAAGMGGYNHEGTPSPER